MQVVDGTDPHLERVTGLRAVHEDGTGQRMSAWAAHFDTRLHCLQRVRDLDIRHPGQPQPLEAAGDHRLHPHAVAGGDGQHRLDGCVVVAPVHVVRRQREVVDLLRTEHQYSAGQHDANATKGQGPATREARHMSAECTTGPTGALRGERLQYHPRP